MRIDKYLWCIRIFKTRNLASKICKKGHVKINNATVKPSKDIFINDQIIIRKNQINLKYIVLNLPTNRVEAKFVNIYSKDITSEDEYKKNELLKFSKDYYRKKGIGRPTKKDRRDIEDYFGITNKS